MAKTFHLSLLMGLTVVFSCTCQSTSNASTMAGGHDRESEDNETVGKQTHKEKSMSVLDYSVEVTSISGQVGTLESYKGKVLVVVNTASKCGFTPQFDGLEKLWDDYKEQGLVVLGFPCNQFGGQDPGSDEEIATYCRKNYGVSFPMHSKIDVNGEDAHPLYTKLKSAAPGIMGTKAIKWNFTKFLIGKDGTIVKRFGSKDKPDAMRKAIEAELVK